MGKFNTDKYYYDFKKKKYVLNGVVCLNPPTVEEVMSRSNDKLMTEHKLKVYRQTSESISLEKETNRLGKILVMYMEENDKFYYKKGNSKIYPKIYIDGIGPYILNNNEKIQYVRLKYEHNIKNE